MRDHKGITVVVGVADENRRTELHAALDAVVTVVGSEPSIGHALRRVASDVPDVVVLDERDNRQAVAAAWWLLARGRREWLWLAVPYALHIVMDVPTHERYETRPLYPLSDWHVLGLSWGDPRIFVPNVVVLAITLLWIRARRARAAAAPPP